MDTDSESSFRKMSKADVLRGFVSDRLAAATQEILAVVERTVAGYEEEASAFRQQIDRQRRQLEVLLQPQVPLSKTGEEFTSVVSIDEEEDCNKEETSSQQLENLKDSTHSTPSRVHPNRRRPGRPRSSKLPSHIDLRIQILQDPHTTVLSKKVSKSSRLLQLRCPRGLQESDFLSLVRSSVSQLSRHNEPFDILTCDKRRRLRPLNPEEIQSAVRSTVYLRLQTQNDRPAYRDHTHPPLREDEGVCSSSTSPTVETEETEAAVRKDVQDVNSSDTDWKPNRSDQELSESELHQKKPKARCSDTKPTETDDNSGRLSCKICHLVVQSEATLDQHAWSHADDPGSVCGACGERSESAEALKDHLEKHHQGHSETFVNSQLKDQCEICQEVFTEKADHECHLKLRGVKEQLKARPKTSTKTKSHICGVCGKSLCDYRSLSRHKMTHSAERPHRCDICGRSFKLHGTLKQHEKTHMARERSYLCDICCKMYLTSKQLQIHMRSHTNEKPYGCGKCGKRFVTKGTLAVHMVVHSEEARYRCSECSCSFKRKYNLENHLRLHSGLKPFVCVICGKACARKTYLTIHMRTHNGERPYKCSVCDKAFTQGHCLKTHMKSHQGGGTTT
ncbi:zinc finger protein 567-like isoform X2 [Sphaeramia orbicularis]|uniref:zinc finger protein 567-like isoform X2 n=1 Tax=Sphaeramia orbicularis TaxID=375764 RepID=UPI0011808B76|nr:zinc finger protein 567-like isoform X2 [Sphaeramia orbicularis]